MSTDVESDGGLGLVEIIIGMFLLAVIAIAIVPALWQGMQYSIEQSATATAVRKLNSLVESVRDNPTCGSIASATATQSFTDGGGRALQSTGTFTACPATTKMVTVTLTAKDASNDTLAHVSAIVYVP